ncbi:MAG: 16S rRNA (guanine(966)-N(2))-methyltransferase RsmD [Nitrospiraceae bacterium]
MRVIAGSQKGRRLLSLKGAAIRPTPGRVKEALFSILGNRINGARFLDLYAGTGAIGIEALSRGAEQVVFVEPNPASLHILRANLERCHMSSTAEVHACSVEEFLKRAGQWNIAFDIIFADPPYRLDSVSMLLPSLERSVIIGPETIVILEHPTKHSIPERIGHLSLLRHYRYGDTSLSTFQVRPEGTFTP